MNEIFTTIKGVITLDDKTYHSFLASENVMRRGVYFLFVCFLIVALPAAVIQLIDNVTPFTPERAATFQEEFFQGFEMAQQFIPEDEDMQLFWEQFRENFAFGLNIAVAMDALPTPLPRAVSGFLQALGSWLSAPFTHLAAWIGYAIWVLLFAKLAGGLGGTNRFLGLTALYAVPNLLGFFNFIPFLGPAISLVGAIWGWVVFIKAVEISQEFSVAKAILFAFLPILILIGLSFAITFLGVISIIGAFN